MNTHLQIGSAFAMSFLLYYVSAAGDKCYGIEHIGYAGIHTILFFFIYYITCIYVFHIKRLKSPSPARRLWLLNVVLVIWPLSLPIAMIGVINERCNFTFNFSSIIVLFPLSLMLADFGGVIRNKIVEDFESRAPGGGDLFSKYPPSNLSEIYGKILVFIIIFVLLIVINA